VSAAAVYDPATLKFVPTGKMTSARDSHTATLLPDGTVLIAGGSAGSGQGFLASAEVYDPSAGAFAAVGDMMESRGFGTTATLMHDGRVLITGGTAVNPFRSIASAEFYTPSILVPPPTLLSASGDGQGQGAIFHTATHQIALSDN